MVGGLIIGGAVDHTGFGQRLARFMVGRAAGSYAKMIAAILVVDLALAFIMPSTMGRVALLLPIAMAIAEEAGFRPGQEGLEWHCPGDGLWLLHGADDDSHRQCAE